MKKFKRLSALALAMVMFSFSLSAFSIPVFADAKDGDTQTFQILFTSDTHGAFTETSYSTTQGIKGGLTRVATVLKQEKEKFEGRTIVVDNGDTIQGNGTSAFINNDEFPTFPNVEAFNVMGFDAATLGNHEFNFGIDTMQKAYSGFKGAKLCANVKDANGNLMEGFEAYKIIELEDGLRVALIGMVTPNIMNWDSANMKAAGLSATNPSTETTAIINKLKGENLADVFIGVYHMGDTIEYANPGSGAIEVCKENPELDLFIGAHFHTNIGDKDNQVEFSGVKFVEIKNAGVSLGKAQITATFKDGKWDVLKKDGDYASSDVKTDVIAIDPETTPDPELSAAMQKYHEFGLKNANTVVGNLVGGPLVEEPEIAGTYNGYLGDTALIDLVNDVMMYYTGAELSGTAALDTYANAQPGQLTRGGISTIYKFDNNTLYKLEMTGTQFKRWMEWAYSFYGDYTEKKIKNLGPAVNPETDISIPYGNGGMAGYNQDNFSGLTYEVDLTKPVGSRVVNMKNLDGTDFDLNKKYIVAANNYRSDTHLLNPSPTSVFQEGEELPKILEVDVASDLTGEGMMGLISDYISKQPNKTITNYCDNNWKFVGFDFDPELRAALARFVAEGKIDLGSPVNPQYDKRAVKISEVLALLDEEKATQTPEPAPVPAPQPEITPVPEPAPQPEITPVPEPAPQPVEEGKTHKVVTGDNLTKLATQYYTTWRSIYNLNKNVIKNPNRIYPGQVLKVS